MLFLFFRVWVLLVGFKTQCPQIYTKLTQFEDNDGRKPPLKALYMFGNCQRPVFSLGVHRPVKIWAQSVIEVARK